MRGFKRGGNTNVSPIVNYMRFKAQTGCIDWTKYEFEEQTDASGNVTGYKKKQKGKGTIDMLNAPPKINFVYLHEQYFYSSMQASCTPYDRLTDNIKVYEAGENDGQLGKCVYDGTVKEAKEKGIFEQYQMTSGARIYYLNKDAQISAFDIGSVALRQWIEFKNQVPENMELDFTIEGCKTQSYTITPDKKKPKKTVDKTDYVPIFQQFQGLLPDNVNAIIEESVNKLAKHLGIDLAALNSLTAAEKNEAAGVDVPKESTNTNTTNTNTDGEGDGATDDLPF